MLEVVLSNELTRLDPQFSVLFSYHINKWISNKTSGNHQNIKRVRHKVGLLNVRTGFSYISLYITRSTTELVSPGFFSTMSELIGLFGKLLKDTHNAKKQGDFLPNFASVFGRECAHL